MALVWQKETKPNRQGKLLTFSFSLTHLIHLKYSGWVHLPVQMAVNRWGWGGECQGMQRRGTCRSTVFIHRSHHSYLTQSILLDSTSEASSIMHRGPHAWSWAWSKSKVDPQQKSGTCARKGGQAEASTLLHESSNSEPETIQQGEIVFHYIRVRVARVGVIPLVGTKPVTVNREHTHIYIYVYSSCIKTLEKTIKETESGPPTWGDRGEKTKVSQSCSKMNRYKSCQSIHIALSSCTNLKLQCC